MSGDERRVLDAAIAFYQADREFVAARQRAGRSARTAADEAARRSAGVRRDRALDALLIATEALHPGRGGGGT